MEAVAAADANVAHARRGVSNRPSRLLPSAYRSGPVRRPSRVPGSRVPRPPPAPRPLAERPPPRAVAVAALSAWAVAAAEPRAWPAPHPRLPPRPLRLLRFARSRPDEHLPDLRVPARLDGGDACVLPQRCRRRPRWCSRRQWCFQPPRRPGRRPLQQQMRPMILRRRSARRRPRARLLPCSRAQRCRRPLPRRPQRASRAASKACGPPTEYRAVARAAFVVVARVRMWSRPASQRAPFRRPRPHPARRPLLGMLRLSSRASSCAASLHGGRAAASDEVARPRSSREGRQSRLLRSRPRSLRPPAPDPRLRPHRRTLLQRSLPPRPRRSAWEGSRRRPGLRRRSSRLLRSL